MQDRSPLYRALHLAERCRTPEPLSASVDAVGRRERWLELPGLTDEAALARRLEAEGISVGAFHDALAEGPASLGERWPETPGWLASLSALYAGGADRAGVTDDEAPFFALVAPLARDGRARAERGARELLARFAGGSSDLGAPFEAEAIVGMLYAELVHRLSRRVARTAVLEMHVARLEGHLAGDTPDERYRAFARRLADPSVAWALWSEYPVLGRLAVETVDQWVRSTLEILERLCLDRVALAETLNGGEELGPLEAIECSEGDQHRGGRSVRILRFRSGLRLVYKPRSLAIDRHFGELLAWLNLRLAGLPPLRGVRVLDRDGYGWAEFVIHAPCRSEAGLARFYVRQGMNLAILHLLGACDFHRENVIASGEHPMLIDLESMLAAEAMARPDERAIDRAHGELAGSVLAIGLLPLRAQASAGFEGIDLSGLGTAADQLTPAVVPFWEAPGTDDMRLGRRTMALAEASNRPTLGGVKGDVRDHAGALLHGFTGLLRTVMRHRGELLAAGGPLERFGADDVRVIVRQTQGYALLLAESYHPDVLRDALDRDRLFDHLWAGASHASEVARVFRHERADMWRGDVPIFTTRADSRDVWTSDGEQIADYFPRSGLELARARASSLDDAALARQVWYVRTALGLADGGEHAPRPPPRQPGEVDEQRTATVDDLLAAASAVGDRLAELALRGRDDATWIGVSLDEHGRPAVGPLGLDLHGGLPGVILFLAELGERGAPRHAALARAGLVTLLAMLDHDPGLDRRVGAFAGRAGAIYTLARLSSLWDRTDLRDRAEALTEALPARIEADDELDVLGGSAGCLGALLALHRIAPRGRTLEIARLCGERLLAAARPTTSGIAWPAPGAPDRFLAGFSHGAAGVAWALLGLEAVTADPRFGAAADGALAHERSLYREAVGNWVDLRPPERERGQPGETFMTSWCHGAPGIGLARLARLEQRDDEAVRREIDAALRTTIASRPANHGLCHGELGNLELLLVARRVLGDPALDAPLARGAGRVLASIDRVGWRCGWPAPVEMPGLLVGLAGIGHGLLRLAASDRVPSVLLLEA